MLKHYLKTIISHESVNFYSILGNISSRDTSVKSKSAIKVKDQSAISFYPTFVSVTISQIKERAIRKLENGNFGTVVINGGVNDCRRNWNIEG